MGGRPLPTCSFCKKSFPNGDARDQHERECVVQQHERRIP